MVLVGTLFVAMLFVGVGLLAERFALGEFRQDIGSAGFLLIAGWGICAALAAILALVDASLFWPMTVLGIAGVAGVTVAVRWSQVGAIALTWLLLLPLLVIATNIPPVMYDEFVQWLPNGRYLVEHDHFPTATIPNTTSAKPGYPPALALMSYLVERAVGSGFEIAPKVFNLLAAGAFGLILADVIAARASAALAIAIGVAAATVLNPFIDPRIALTSYTDTASSFTLAICLYACGRSVSASDSVWLWRVGLPAVVLVLLRETNVVLIVGLGLGLIILRSWRTFLAVVSPSLSAFVLWRLYLHRAAIAPAMEPRAISEWDWQAPLTVLRVLFTDRLQNNPLGVAALVAVLGLAGLSYFAVCRASQDIRRLYTLVLTTFGIWAIFLAWSYIAVFTPDEVSGAGSAWRYGAQLGPLVILMLFVAANALQWSSSIALQQRTPPRVHALIAAAIVGVGTWCIVIASWQHWKIDCRHPEIVAVRSALHAIAAATDSKRALFALFGEGADGYGYAVSYQLGRPVESVPSITSIAQADRLGDVIDFTALNRIRARETVAVVLLRWNDGAWQTIVERKLSPSNYGCSLRW